MNINDLTRATSLSGSDDFPIWSASDADTRKASLEALSEFFGVDAAATSAVAAAAEAAISAALAAQYTIGLGVWVFGAVGDDAIDDTAALQAALASGQPLNWGNRTYRITSPLVATLAKMAWTSNGARIRYDGAVVQYAVRLTVGLNTFASLSGSGLTIDAGNLAYTALRISSSAVVGDAETTWPIAQFDSLRAENWYRSGTTFGGGDGVFISGGWHVIRLNNASAIGGLMATGAGVAGSQGAFGITVGGSALPCPKHIIMTGSVVENIWSEDASYKLDQDAIRIFQDVDDPRASCQIYQSTVRNVSGRAIKLHSGVNAIIDGLSRELDGAVVPQQGLYDNPDIDCQQCPATVTNCRFHYKTSWHNSFVQYTDQGGYKYGAQQVSNISWNVENAAGNAIAAVRITSNAGDAGTPGANSTHRAVVSNLSGQGDIAHFLTVNLRGTGANGASLVNAIGVVTTACLAITGSGTANFFGSVSGAINLGTLMPISTGGSALRLISSVACHGFNTGVLILRNNLFIQAGSGSPETVVTAPKGSIYARDDGGAVTTLYIKETGTLNSTGWVAK